MSGVTVSGMLVWTINRVGDGPFKALKMLGNIQSGNPTHANESLTKQAVAVVRSCIANSTIDQLITNRKMLRERIKQDMFEQVKRWGVWLETIEITGVQIMSNSLFKNLQANYREKIHQEATLYAMKIKQDVDQQRNQIRLEVEEKQREINEKERKYVNQIENEKKEAREQFLL